MDGTLTGTTAQVQSGPGCNDNELVLHITQISRIGNTLSDDLVSYLRHLLGELLFFRGDKSAKHIELSGFEFHKRYSVYFQWCNSYRRRK